MNVDESLSNLLFADCKHKLWNRQRLLYRNTVSPSAILVRSTKPSPNRFAWIHESGFWFIKLIAWNRTILNRFNNNNNAICIAQICRKQQMSCSQCPKRKAFSLALNVSIDMSVDCKSFGRLFHTEGPWTEKPRFGLADRLRPSIAQVCIHRYILSRVNVFCAAGCEVSATTAALWFWQSPSCDSCREQCHKHYSPCKQFSFRTL